MLPIFVNDPNAWLKDVKPFLIRDPADFRSKGPNDLESHAYARDFEEVKSLGSCGARSGRPSRPTPRATGPRTRRRPGAASSGRCPRRRVSLVDNARLYAMLYMTAADALISVWDDKAYYSFWRPITAIREADTDGNPRTEKDAGWTPLIPTPPYTDHPSGHAGLTGSIVATLQDFFGTDEIGWSDTNNGGLTRSFTRFSARDRRGRRRPRLVGHPFPHGGRAGREAGP